MCCWSLANGCSVLRAKIAGPYSLRSRRFLFSLEVLEYADTCTLVNQYRRHKIDITSLFGF